jgi:hypothetical protein
LGWDMAFFRDFVSCDLRNAFCLIRYLPVMVQGSTGSPPPLRGVGIVIVHQCRHVHAVPASAFCHGVGVSLCQQAGHDGFVFAVISIACDL